MGEYQRSVQYSIGKSPVVESENHGNTAGYTGTSVILYTERFHHKAGKGDQIIDRRQAIVYRMVFVPTMVI
jgi:hypothetical protein